MSYRWHDGVVVRSPDGISFEMWGWKTKSWVPFPEGEDPVEAWLYGSPLTAEQVKAKTGAADAV